MNSAINYHSEFANPEQEQQALSELCDYLVYKGVYKDSDAARQDARQRVDFLEKADFFASDARLADASRERKSIAALIQGHDLQQLLTDNDGYLPAMESGNTGVSKRPITEIFSAIELDLRSGLSQEQIIRKLVDSGVAEENASDALQAVMRQRRQKQRSRLLAATTIVVLAIILFFFAR